MKMKKIALFIEKFEPEGGGSFQYNQIMLDAVAALPKDTFSVVVGYTSELWQDYLAGYELKEVHIPNRGFWGRARLGMDPPRPADGTLAQNLSLVSSDGQGSPA